MPAYVRKVKNKNDTISVQIEYKEGRKRTGIKHVGTAHNERELKLLSALAYEKIHENQLSLNLYPQRDDGLRLESTHSELLYETLEKVYEKLGFDEVEDEIYKQLVLARIIEPASKLDTIRILDDLGLEAPSNTAIHRCLSRTLKEDYRDLVSRLCYRKTTKKNLKLVLYDVTTLYFEIQKDDEYRKSGYSKERRLEPQIVIGLLTDSEGFPLEIQSFQGNLAEIKTIIPVLVSFKERHGLNNITITADSAMFSSGTIEILEELGYHYIIGSRMTKTPYGMDDRFEGNSSDLTDGEIIESYRNVTVKGKRTKRREIFQYRHKRAVLDLSNIEKAIAKANRMIDNEINIKRNRFLKVSGAKKELNQTLIKEARERAGIKGYITDLTIPAQKVIDAYYRIPWLSNAVPDLLDLCCKW